MCVLACHNKREYIWGAGVLGDEAKVVLAENGDAAFGWLRGDGGGGWGGGGGGGGCETREWRHLNVVMLTEVGIINAQCAKGFVKFIRPATTYTVSGF